MIFAGDFAQLPPALGSPLYSQTIGVSGKSNSQQEDGMGKSIWHRVTTVVILRQNMRQKNMTAEDNKFRTVLENMRYKKCTPSDIAFLRSRISANVPGADSICKSEFRNVPMITALNIDKDEINQIGCERFAAENMSNLTNFYSEDVARQSNDNALDEKRTKKKLLSIKEMTDDIHMYHQNYSLCVNMPVMIRRNLATELCITKGQEGTVYGWQTKKGSRGQLMLDVLFIKLINLPDGKINVVPVYSTTNSMQITLPNGCAVNVTREQVEVLPNFAMTDFASQVDINNCKDYHGIYTALSRGSTASGTLLIQGFSPHTREEFRELEILDEITRLQYENQICSSIKGTYRQDLIKAYQKWKGKHYTIKTFIFHQWAYLENGSFISALKQHQKTVR
ncbi:uncharacterized protein C8R40DRAFT_1162715 [Lentinula edodes]|uniref:uncharacterized protein n=1 Tax=Lentinula edodes TaxID=5353 RepID=UPI001E8D2738|nr:uncharacterized protein C8R40DRAFT_1162715 [Lentinula edodes]KAH7871527.1 hypothetical protein C8R40DRAFT_1162715 [Lentinula edodes]